MDKSYDWIRGIKKGAIAAAAIGAGLVAGAETLGSLDAAQEVSAISVAAAIVGAFRVGLNWWKVNRDLADKRYLR